MYAHMGMKIEEWADGRVNIGVAVCPTKPAAIITAVAASEENGNGVLMSRTSAAGNIVVVPKSAYIIRAPEHCQSQSGLSVTYAHQPNRPPNLIIMLTPQDQGCPDKISCQQAQKLLSNQGTDFSVIERKMKQIDESVVYNQEVSDRWTNSEDKGHSEERGDEKSPSSCANEKSLTMPLHIAGVTKASLGKSSEVKIELEKLEAGSVDKQTSMMPSKRSSDMKRVSWMEDTGKESKKDVMRKSNGMGNGYTNRSSSTKKQNGVISEDVRNVEEPTKGNKRSSDNSRIPHITSSAGDYPTTCEFYRRQMLRECMYNNPATTVDNWYGYTSIQKYAGQKVVKKIAEEQKRLEEDISNRRKTEIWILGTESDELILSPPSVPLRKKTQRLKPMQFVH